MAYIFIVKYSVQFDLFNFGLGLGLLNLASASTSASSVWPWLTSLHVTTCSKEMERVYSYNPGARTVTQVKKKKKRCKWRQNRDVSYPPRGSWCRRDAQGSWARCRGGRSDRWIAGGPHLASVGEAAPAASWTLRCTSCHQTGLWTPEIHDIKPSTC